MKKDKNWLKEEIKKVSNNYPTYHDERDDLIKKMVNMHEILELIDQIDEPEKVVVSKMESVEIPQYVADYIKVSKDNNESLNQAFVFIDDKEYKELWNWLFPIMYEGGHENQETFARAWLDGYTIEKETMYYVIFVESEDEEKGQALYKDFNYDGDKVVSTHIETFSKRISLEAGNFHFTEQEIKSIDERYSAFKVEVSK